MSQPDSEEVSMLLVICCSDTSTGFQDQGYVSILFC